MSAYLLSDFHLSALVKFASRKDLIICNQVTWESMLVRGNENLWVKILGDDNLKSVNHRYNRTDSILFKYDRNAPELTAIQAIKAAKCLDYQTSCHPQYKTTLTHQFVDALIYQSVNDLPEFNDAPWCIDSLDDLKAA